MNAEIEAALEERRKWVAAYVEAALARGVRPIENDDPATRFGSYAEDDPVGHARIAAETEAARDCGDLRIEDENE